MQLFVDAWELRTLLPQLATAVHAAKYVNNAFFVSISRSELLHAHFISATVPIKISVHPVPNQHVIKPLRVKLTLYSAREKKTRSSSNFQAMPTFVLILSCTTNGWTCLASCTFCYRTLGQFITEQQFKQLSQSCRHFLERNTDFARTTARH